MTPLQMAQQLTNIGFSVIPIPYGSKSPGRLGWQNERHTVDDLPRVFNSKNQNIGALCGEPSGGLVDADLDSREAIDAAEVLMPPTGRIGGRMRRPRSHRWYRTEPPPPGIKHFIDPIQGAHGARNEKAMLLELRTTGGHTVVYGRHPDGDAYHWDAAGEPSAVNSTDLERAVALTAAAALMGRYWPAPGVRHTIALAWAGFLLSSGLSDVEAERVIAAACFVAGDREGADRVGGVKTTRACIEAGEPYTAASTLIKAFGGDDGRRALDAIANWLGLSRPVQGQDSTPAAPSAVTGRSDGAKETQASAIVRLAGESFAFHTSDAGEPFAVARNGPPLARMLRGGRESLRALLAQAYAEAYDRAPSSAALADALLVIEGRCLKAERVPLSLRVARAGDSAVLDLGRADGQVAIISPQGWTVGPTPAGIIWRRTELSGELPLPVTGGRLETLRALLNVTDTGWLFLRSALVAALLADVPAPVTLFRGPQGSGKSSAARIFTMLIDPSAAPLRAAPDRPDGWQVAAAGSRLVTLDNVSVIPAWLSDAICRASTGDGLVKRRLYSDDGLVVLAYQRVVSLTSIDPGALRGDLADRLLPVELGRISQQRRRLDAELATAFVSGHAGWLGALLDLLAQVLTVLPTITLDELPRMADFGRVLAAIDAVTGTNGSQLFMEVGTELAAEVVEGDAVAQAVVAFMAGGDTWRGSASELLVALSPERPVKGWPATGHHLSGRLRRTSEALLGVGIAVTFDRDKHARAISIEKVSTEASPASSASFEPSLDSDIDDADGDAYDARASQRHQCAADSESDCTSDDAGDAGDAERRASLDRGSASHKRRQWIEERLAGRKYVPHKRDC